MKKKHCHKGIVPSSQWMGRWGGFEHKRCPAPEGTGALVYIFTEKRKCTGAQLWRPPEVLNVC
jgi:hypothetical protein